MGDVELVDVELVQPPTLEQAGRAGVVAEHAARRQVVRARGAELQAVALRLPVRSRADQEAPTPTPAGTGRQEEVSAAGPDIRRRGLERLHAGAEDAEADAAVRRMREIHAVGHALAEQ